MRHKLFAVLSLIVLVSLLVPAAFAAEPAEPAVGTEKYWFDWTWLGEIWEIWVPAFDPVVGNSITGPFLKNYPVDIWLYRPDTDPFVPLFPAQWAALPGPWWIKEEGESGLRRQTWPNQSMSTVTGTYYAKFMLPRDEVWYPCGFPCRWQCNVYTGAPVELWTGFHSPRLVEAIYPDDTLVGLPADYTKEHFPLFWPWDLDWWDVGLGWINPYGPPDDYDFYDYPIGMDATPFDTVHPMELWIVDGINMTAMYRLEAGILGYQWKISDPEMGSYYGDWPYLCGDPYEWPDPALGMQ
jgi:hypothetical protein